MEMERRAKSLLDRIPGYRGYRGKEDRRDADRRVREQIAAEFGQRLRRVQAIGQALADQRRLDAVQPVDDLVRTLRNFIQRVETATYGYGGLFSDRNVDASALDQLRDFDKSLLDSVDELDNAVTAVETAHNTGADITSMLLNAQTVVRVVVQKWDTRNQVIETGKPIASDSVLSFLKPTVSSDPHPAYAMRQGGALAILGDNFIVDAHIEVDAGPDSFRLLRLEGGSSESERWLDVPAHHSSGISLVAPTTDAFSIGPPPAIGTTPYTIAASGMGQGKLIGAGGGSGDRRVNFWRLREEGEGTPAIVLDWGNERQVMIGHVVPPNDIEIFGPSVSG